jgi:hypothetical protein
MNEEAAAAIDTPPELPDVGTMVVYIPRAGMQRMGRREFPAIVLAGNYEEQTLELMVMMEPEDMITESHVHFQSHNQNQHCWRYVRVNQGPQATESELVRQNKMGERLARLEQALFGEYEQADLCVYDILAKFETQLKKAGGKKG